MCLAASAVAGCSIFPKAQSAAPATAAASPLAVAMLDSAHGWELTAAGVQRTADGGRTWQRITNLPRINYVWGTLVSFPAITVAWLCEQGRARGSSPGSVGDTRTSASPPARCFVTRDGGMSWTQHDVPDTGTSTVGRGREDVTINWLTAIGPDVAWIVVGTLDTFAGGGQESINTTDVRALRTDDAGAKWSVLREVHVPSGHSVTATGADWVDVGASGSVYLSGFDMGIDRRTDTGAGWRTLAVPIPPLGAAGESEYCSLAEVGNTLVVTIREYVHDAPAHFYEVSADGGATWSQATAPRVDGAGRSMPAC